MRSGYIFVAIFVILSSFLRAQDFQSLLEADELKIEADELSHNVETGAVLAKGNVVVTYGILKLTA